MTFTNILVATDLSDASRRAVEEARALAGVFDARLHLLHVVAVPLDEAWVGYTPGPDFMAMIDELQRRARVRLEGATAWQSLASGRVAVATSWGDPVDEILEYAAAHTIDLIVCGTHGRRGWNRVVMGSVAEHLVRFAPCPVLTVPPAGAETRAAA